MLRQEGKSSEDNGEQGWDMTCRQQGQLTSRIGNGTGTGMGGKEHMMGNGTGTGMQDARWHRGHGVRDGEWTWDGDTRHKMGTGIGTGTGGTE